MGHQELIVWLGVSQSIPHASYRRLRGYGPKLADDGVGGGLAPGWFDVDICS